jgi:hypothetical protein
MRRRLELAAQDVGKSAFPGFNDGAGVMGDRALGGVLCQLARVGRG